MGLPPGPPPLILALWPHTSCLLGRAPRPCRKGPAPRAIPARNRGRWSLLSPFLINNPQGQPGIRIHAAAPIEIHEQNYDHKRSTLAELLPSAPLSRVGINWESTGRRSIKEAQQGGHRLGVDWEAEQKRKRSRLDVPNHVPPCSLSLLCLLQTLS